MSQHAEDLLIRDALGPLVVNVEINLGLALLYDARASHRRRDFRVGLVPFTVPERDQKERVRPSTFDGQIVAALELWMHGDYSTQLGVGVKRLFRENPAIVKNELELLASLTILSSLAAVTAVERISPEIRATSGLEIVRRLATLALAVNRGVLAHESTNSKSTEIAQEVFFTFSVLPRK